MAQADVRSDGLVHLVIVEQVIQVAQDGVDARGHLGDACDDVFLGRLIDPHAISSVPFLLFVLVPCHLSLPFSPHPISLEDEWLCRR
jgi:hypothetical protein